MVVLPVEKFILVPVVKTATSIFRVAFRVVKLLKKVWRRRKSLNQMSQESLECQRTQPICTCKIAPKYTRREKCLAVQSQVEQEIAQSRLLLTIMETQQADLARDNSATAWSVSAIRKRLYILSRWNLKMRKNIGHLADIDYVAWESFIQDYPTVGDGFDHISCEESPQGGEEQKSNEVYEEESQSDQ